MVNEALPSTEGGFEALHTGGAGAVDPGKLIQILFPVCSERQLVGQMQYNLLFRGFVYLGIDVWSAGLLTTGMLQGGWGG
ncbi:hypothetical protein [Falsirhodobacter deserti]|uniref:hypothetical protein n=1 Tax=Falsirhodobacter deserti TaxID=1365611 RepID=UPI000FE34E6D|nr:hypothetical protein [Falsirhodobacter deserti]